jgi:chorismate dehydratase
MSTPKQIKISAVSYANTFPFLYGIEQKMKDAQIDLSLDVPSECARKLKAGEVDLGLIPVAEMRHVPNAQIVSDYCIGAVGTVKTVLLMSTVPLDEIREVYLDSESRTSVNLVKVLAKHHWKKEWLWHPAPADFPDAARHSSIVLIGDKTYAHRDHYPYIYDLSEHWMTFSGKPFVFAAWVANKALPESFLRQFNAALSHGLQNIDAALDVYAQASVRDELRDYLNNYISYRLDDQKREGMQLFLSFLD